MLDVCPSQLTPAAGVHPFCVAQVSKLVHWPETLPVA
jgi:hypothetical protein